jgi:hypothetical protein
VLSIVRNHCHLHSSLLQPFHIPGGVGHEGM